MQSHPPSSAEAYRALARTWAATVTVVTAARGDALDGFTATAFLTVSIEPPIVLVSATRSGSPAAMLRDATSFAVNLLAPTQSELANAFARPAFERGALWESVAWSRDASGAPVLADTAGAFSASVRDIVDAGDHVLVLGDVTAIHLGEAVDTLVYHNRAYGRVARDV